MARYRKGKEKREGILHHNTLNIFPCMWLVALSVATLMVGIGEVTSCHEIGIYCSAQFAIAVARQTEQIKKN